MYIDIYIYIDWLLYKSDGRAQWKVFYCTDVYTYIYIYVCVYVPLFFEGWGAKRKEDAPLWYRSIKICGMGIRPFPRPKAVVEAEHLDCVSCSIPPTLRVVCIDTLAIIYNI